MHIIANRFRFFLNEMSPPKRGAADSDFTSPHWLFSGFLILPALYCTLLCVAGRL